MSGGDVGLYVLSIALGIVLGGVVTILVSRYYYKKSSVEINEMAESLEGRSDELKVQSENMQKALKGITNGMSVPGKFEPVWEGPVFKGWWVSGTILTEVNVIKSDYSDEELEENEGAEDR